jgi:hypothetical protein
MVGVCREAEDIDSLGRLAITSPVQSVYINSRRAVVPETTLATLLLPGMVTQGHPKILVHGRPLTGVGYATTGGVMATGSPNVIMPSAPVV